MVLKQQNIIKKEVITSMQPQKENAKNEENNKEIKTNLKETHQKDEEGKNGEEDFSFHK